MSSPEVLMLERELKELKAKYFKLLRTELRFIDRAYLLSIAFLVSLGVNVLVMLTLTYS